MIHHYNLIAQGEGAVVRDIPVGAAVTKGQALTYGATTLGSTLIPAAVTADDIAGVANETQATASTITTGTLSFAKVVVNPDSVYLAEWNKDAATDVDVVAGVNTNTLRLEIGATDDDFDGGWVYLNTGTGAGQLAYIGAATTTVLTFDTTTALTAPDATTDILLIRKPWRHNANSGVDLAADISRLNSGASLAQTGSILILENYIRSTTLPLAPLRPRQHHALSGLQNDNVKFYADIHLADNLLRGLTTIA